MRYQDNKGRSKAARFWAMTAKARSLRPISEIDAFRWVPLGEAAANVTRTGERDFLSKVAETLSVTVQEGTMTFSNGEYIVVQERQASK